MMITGTVGLNALPKIKVVKPDNAGSFWRGIAFDKLVKVLLRTGPESKGWNAGKPSVALSKDQADIAASNLVTIPNVPQDVCIGVTASNALRKCLRFYIGVGPVVMDDKAMGGGGGKRLYNHTIEEDVEEALAWVADRAPVIEKQLRELQKQTMERSKLEHLLLQAARNDYVAWSRLKLMEENLPLKEGKPIKLQEVFAAFDKVSTLSPPLRQLDQKLGFFRMIAAASSDNNS